MPPQTTLLLALSGPSSSGKTTLARLLRDVLTPHAFILHEDDFYKTDAEIPVVTVSDGRELQDWDCLGSVDVQPLTDMLRFVKEHGVVKEGFESKEDKNSVGEVPGLGEGVVEKWKTSFQTLLEEGVRIVIVDGFLLYSQDLHTIRELFDIKILLKADYQTVKRRREARKGYVTLEGFWEDPEGYVDLVVWPNYVKDHAFLFKGGDVEGRVDGRVAEELGIEVAPDGKEGDLGTVFEWVCAVLGRKLEGFGKV